MKKIPYITIHLEQIYLWMYIKRVKRLVPLATSKTNQMAKKLSGRQHGV